MENIGNRSSDCVTGTKNTLMRNLCRISERMSYLTEPKVIVSAQIAREQREALERQAAEEDRTLSAVVRRVIADYLNGAGKREGAASGHLHLVPSDDNKGAPA